jgi:hypothetical protein
MYLIQYQMINMASRHTLMILPTHIIRQSLKQTSIGLHSYSTRTGIFTFIALSLSPYNASKRSYLQYTHKLAWIYMMLYTCTMGVDVLFYGALFMWQWMKLENESPCDCCRRMQEEVCVMSCGKKGILWYHVTRLVAAVKSGSDCLQWVDGTHVHHLGHRLSSWCPEVGQDDDKVIEREDYGRLLLLIFSTVIISA